MKRAKSCRRAYRKVQKLKKLQLALAAAGTVSLLHGQLIRAEEVAETQAPVTVAESVISPSDAPALDTTGNTAETSMKDSPVEAITPVTGETPNADAIKEAEEKIKQAEEELEAHYIRVSEIESKLNNLKEEHQNASNKLAEA